MSTDTVATATAPRHLAGPEARVTVGGLLRGEWIKFRSLSSSWWTLGGGLAFMVFLGVVFASSSTGPGEGGPGGGDFSVDPASLSLAGYNIAQLAIAVLGVLMVTGEYASGTVRGTFSAVPRRWPVVVAKAVVLAAVLWVTTTIASFAAFFAGQAAYGDGAASITDDGVLRMVMGTGLYLTAIGLLAMGIAWLLRSTAAAVGTVLGLVLVVPGLTGLLPDSWGPDVARWLPTEAGGSIMSLVTDSTGFAPWTGYAVLVGWVAVLLVGATVLLKRRDV